jgi:GH15 family glucan-1,4-alpha-glucosidase
MIRDRQPPIGDYAFLSDCQSVALVSRAGSIDWCCVPRIDAGSVFGRLIDWERGGYCLVGPAEGGEFFRKYRDQSLVLETVLRAGGGEARLLDCLVVEPEADEAHLLRVVEGVRGELDLCVEVCPRFDYGEVRPWLRRDGPRLHCAIGGNDALVISCDADLEPSGGHDLTGRFTVRAGERVRLSLRFSRPHLVEQLPPPPRPEELDRLVEASVRWWDRWAAVGRIEGEDAGGMLRSALVLKGLTNRATGAIAAAATASLPEVEGGERNWDYRFSWVRDSTLAVRALAELGFEAEADRFRRFIQRSAAGHVDDLQIAYGVGGERRLPEFELGAAGYGGARPVRIGNTAGTQRQLDVLGELVLLAWRWHRRGYSPDDDHWRFLAELVDAAAERWPEPDHGIWEVRGTPRHFVHSKVLCWVALDRGIALSEECLRRAPVRRWRAAAAELREAVEDRGYDRDRGVFVRAFDERTMDAALLLLPVAGFLEYTDERMVRTVDAIRAELETDGFLWRYRGDEIPGGEGAFLPCTFWLAECLARQDRYEEARAVFDRAASAANDLGLFSEEYDLKRQRALGNFPQTLTHLSHIAAGAALARVPAA